MKRFAVIIAVLSAGLTAFAQKPALDHSVYDSWKSISSLRIQDCGDWAFYTVTPQQGDAVTHIYNVRTMKDYPVDRASGVIISQDGKKAMFRIAPMYQQTRQAKIDKKKPDEMPKDSLGVLDLATGHIEKIANVKSFAYPDLLGDWAAFQKNGKDNDTLYVLNIKTMQVDSLLSVNDFSFPEKGDRLAFITEPGEKDSITSRGIFLYDPASKNSIPVLTGEKKSAVKGIHLNEDGSRMAFYANLDTVDKADQHYSLYMYDAAAGDTRMLLKDSTDLMPKDWRIDPKAEFRFLKNYMVFGVQPRPREKDTSLVDFEQARLDIWNWQDEYLQPTQNINANKERNRGYAAKIGYDGKGFVRIADIDMPDIKIAEYNYEDYILVANDKPYRRQEQWKEMPNFDIYKVSLKDGSRELIEKGADIENLYQSPDGKHYLMFNYVDQNWHQYDLATGLKRNLTENLGVPFGDEENDRPEPSSSYGGVRWSEDGRYAWICDRYDIWQIDLAGVQAPKRLSAGREVRTSYRFVNAYHHTIAKKSGILDTADPVYFYTKNDKTKEMGLARMDFSKKNPKMENLVEGPYDYNQRISVSKGKKPVIAYAKGNYETGNDLWITYDSFKTQKQLTDINPQRRDYNWGTVELVSWTVKDGSTAEGLLFKPEDFDPAKKYPVLVYFYEKNSDQLYVPRAPAPSASTINIPYFTSNGYICFVPDIRYVPGHPGESCMDYVMSGVDMLCEYPWIDGDHMGIQGQSWGGYQVAYMVTRTGRFAAAGAGAPVSNMTSAYGGIRWGAGIARTMQYENGQSRIGTTLWDGLDLYLENSPLFGLPNVTTPLLIMHNDKDGAVPWWQGIELFAGMRRLNKPVWMLQYNDEEHNLMERRNRKDLSIRLEQFFDHFLKGKPMPVWMSRGVPATLKGIDYGFEYDDEQ